MLGSNPTRDSRMRRHHADGEGGRNTVFPFFILMLSPYALKKTHKKDGAKRLIIDVSEND